MFWKRLFIVIFMLSLSNLSLYADNPFENTKVSTETSVSDENSKAANVKANDNKSKDDESFDDLASYTFPITGTIDYDDLRLRKWPWGEVNGKYDKNTKITVLGVSGEFYEVIVLGVKGYMHRNYISIPGVPSSGKEPAYPGDTKSGGYLSQDDGKTRSDGIASGDIDPDEEVPVTSTTGGISAEEFKKQMASMATPTRDEITKLAASIGISADYVKILVGTTQREGYFNDTYLHYGWASAMINNPVTISQMQGWDPGRSGDANYYSQANINKGYNEASSDVLKSVYLALKYRNTKICECNGMYKPYGPYSVPSSYNELYRSSTYNCCIYETK